MHTHTHTYTYKNIITTYRTSSKIQRFQRQSLSLSLTHTHTHTHRERERFNITSPYNEYDQCHTHLMLAVA